VSSDPNRRSLSVGIIILALAAVTAGGIIVARTMFGADAGYVGDESTVAATPTQSSPSLNVDGTVATPTAKTSLMATDPPSTVTDPPPRQSSPRQVEVVQTYATWDEMTGVSAGGFVSQTVEQAGTCTLTLTRGATTLTVTGQAFPDASSTACGSLTVAPDRLSSGTWTSVLDYSSGTSTGQSSSLQVKVP